MRRPSSPNLSQEQVLQAALNLMKEQHLEDLQMRTLAQALDVTPRALYRYYPTKEDLMRAAFIHVLERITSPDSGPWQDRLRQVAQDFRQLAREHKHMAAYLFAPHDANYAEARMLEFFLTAVQEAGVPPDLRFVTALNVFGNLITSLRHERNSQGTETAAASEAGYTAIREFLKGREADYTVTLTLLEQRKLEVGGHFENQLDLIIGGIIALTQQAEEV